MKFRFNHMLFLLRVNLNNSNFHPIRMVDVSNEKFDIFESRLHFTWLGRISTSKRSTRKQWCVRCIKMSFRSYLFVYSPIYLFTYLSTYFLTETHNDSISRNGENRRIKTEKRSKTWKNFHTLGLEPERKHGVDGASSWLIHLFNQFFSGKLPEKRSYVLHGTDDYDEQNFVCNSPHLRI